jgi:hypothetical protein
MLSRSHRERARTSMPVVVTLMQRELSALGAGEMTKAGPRPALSLGIVSGAQCSPAM